MEEGEVFAIGLRGFKAVHIGDLVRWWFLGLRLRFAGITDRDRRRFVERFEQGVQNVVELILCVHVQERIPAPCFYHGSIMVLSWSHHGLIMVCSWSPYSGVI